jgi:chromosome segregation ATPase
VLSERDYNGKLKVDHKARKLEIEASTTMFSSFLLIRVQIQPDDTQKNKQGRETTTLSGGEKSYSTICLLLSLWDAVGTPIRCLDEL